MSAPKRIQRKRSKGWRMPEGAVYVGRPSAWGNPWRAAHQDGWCWLDGPGGVAVHPSVRLRPGAAGRAQMSAWAAEAVERFARQMRLDPIPAEDLAGHDLACWCPLNHPCHADVLLELANRDADA